jgi:rod shape-determining protein MreC
MDNVISRFRNTANLIVLAAVLVLQVIGLAMQVKRPTESGSTRLIRVWAISIVTPLTRGIVHTQDWFADAWHNYIWLRGVRQQNEELKDQIVQMKMREVRLVEDANQARRLQLLLGFKENYIAKTVPAQVISTTGSEFSRAIYIDKGSNDGIKQDMPVVVPEGIVGKILRAFPSTSLVLLINDPTSGAGVILEKSRLQGVLKGTSSGATIMHNVMSDEKVEVGEHILTSGGDRIFPKGMPVGTVTSVTPGQDLFLNIRVRPAAPIGRLEEVLVITKMDERTPVATPDDNPMRAIDILAERLPTVVAPPVKTETPEGTEAPAKPGTVANSEKKNTATELKPVPQKPAVATPNAVKRNVPAELKPDLQKSPVTIPAGVATQPKPAKQAQAAPVNKPPDTNKETPR